jgi:glycosyltransferase involved in cell wall biosynthesis
LVVDGETGLLYRGQNVEDAVKQLYGILDNPPLHQQMSQAAVERVQQKFAIQKVGDDYIHLLQKICSGDYEINGEVEVR